MGAYEPVAQLVQEADPYTPAYLPAAHGLHGPIDPVVPKKYPGLQRVQIDRPVTAA